MKSITLRNILRYRWQLEFSGFSSKTSGSATTIIRRETGSRPESIFISFLLRSPGTWQPFSNAHRKTSCEASADRQIRFFMNLASLLLLQRECRGNRCCMWAKRHENQSEEGEPDGKIHGQRAFGKNGSPNPSRLFREIWASHNRSFKNSATNLGRFGGFVSVIVAISPGNLG